MNFDDVRARAPDVRAEGVEKVREVNDMGLLCDVFKNCETLRPNGGKHHVDGCADGNDIKINMASDELIGIYGYGAVTDVYGSAESLKALYVLVDGAYAEITAAGERYVGFAAPSEKSAEEVIGRPKLSCKVLRDLVRGNVAGVDENGGAAYDSDRRTHKGKHIIKSIDIAYVRNVFKKTGSAGKNGSGNNGNRRVFSAAYLNFTMERLSAFDNEFIQYSISLNELITVTIIIAYKTKNEKSFIILYCDITKNNAERKKLLN